MKKMADRMAIDEAYTIDYENRSKRQSNGYVMDCDGFKDCMEDIKISSCDESCMLENVCAARYIDPYQYNECKGNAIFDWGNDFDNSFRWAMLEPWVREVP